MKSDSAEQPTLRQHILSLGLVSMLLFLISWQADDAYHAYVMARNLAEGNGFVYALGERVNASTCPLWTLLCAGVYALFGNMYFSTAMLSLFTTIAAAALLFFRCRTKRILWFCATMFIISPCSIFGVSGLENALLYLLSGLMIYQLLPLTEALNRRQLFAIALTMALLAWTRMDIVLLFTPACICAYLTRRAPGISFLAAVLIAAAGLLPFIGWELFSTFYYGFPFPNTAYAKLSAGLPLTFYIQSGLCYTLWSFICFTAIPITIYLTLGLYAKRRIHRDYFSLPAGIILYCLYIIYVGGDFMLGRHFSVVLYVCLILLAALQPAEGEWPVAPRKLIGLALFSTGLVYPILTLFLFADAKLKLPLTASAKAALGIDIETHYNLLASETFSPEITAWGATGSALALPRRFREGITTDRFSCYMDVISPAKEELPPVVCPELAFGYYVYAVNRHTHAIDCFGLGDALIARLPSDNNSPRIGHISRRIPDGYIETLAKGENCIQDENLHRYYDRLKLVISGDLRSTERLKAIWDFNTGMYNHLLPRK